MARPRHNPRFTLSSAQAAYTPADPARAELLGLYAEVDALTAGATCDASAECCSFSNTGREPYPTAVELAEIELARRRNPAPRKRSLPALGERRCPLLGDDRRCTIYASRPFGCRTFFCHRGRGPDGEPVVLPRAELRRISNAILDLSARRFPENPGPRPLSNAIKGRT
jgi:Fe-S-cluster containining protein